MKPISIFGAGGLGREIQSLLQFLPEWKLTGFYDDNPQNKKVNDFPILGGIKELMGTKEHVNLVIALGDPTAKRKIVDQIKKIPLIGHPVLIHPSVIIQDPNRVHVGAGSIITAGVIFTTNIQVGEHVLVNLNCTIGHDVVIGDYTSVMPGVNIAGQVKIDTEVLIGSGANILNGIRIKHQGKVGAGALVNRDVEAGSTVVGVPAKPLSKKQN